MLEGHRMPYPFLTFEISASRIAMSARICSLRLFGGAFGAFDAGVSEGLRVPEVTFDFDLSDLN